MTRIAPASVKRSPFGELLRSVQRERALIALFDLDRRKTFGLRAARWYAFGVFGCYAMAIALAQGKDQRAVSHGFVHAALSALSWGVGAPAALGAARVLAQDAERDSLTTLAMQRGFSKPSLLGARTLAIAVRIARLVALPALLLIALSLVRGSSVAWALAVAPAAVVYASALGLSLALLAQFSAELAPTRPRAFVLALALGPLLISQAYPAVPSLPRLCSVLLARLLDAGASLS